MQVLPHMLNLCLVRSANAEMTRVEMSQEGKEQCPSISGIPRSPQASSTSLVLNVCAPRFEGSRIRGVSFLCIELSTTWLILIVSLTGFGVISLA